MPSVCRATEQIFPLDSMDKISANVLNFGNHKVNPISMRDIQTYDDISDLVSRFYDKLIADDATKEKFLNLNLQMHLPKIVDFWAFILIDKAGYTGNVFDKHLHLNLEPVHFEHWINHWTNTVNEMFLGPKAELAIQRALLLSYTFQSKLFNTDKNKII